MIGWYKKRLARRAIDRCWGVPYLAELSPWERHGMLLLERDGEVVSDEGLSGEPHWHCVKPPRSAF